MGDSKMVLYREASWLVLTIILRKAPSTHVTLAVMTTIRIIDECRLGLEEGETLPFLPPPRCSWNLPRQTHRSSLLFFYHFAAHLDQRIAAGNLCLDRQNLLVDGCCGMATMSQREGHRHPPTTSCQVLPKLLSGFLTFLVVEWNFWTIFHTA